MEIWKDVTGYEGLYQVSSMGRVRSVMRVVSKTNCTQKLNGKILSLTTNSHGYIAVSLHKNKKRKTMKLHRLVAIEFVVNKYNKQYINHIDGNKTNNMPSNLEWATPSENNQHAYDTGLKSPDNSDGSKLSYKLAYEIRGKINNGDSQRLLSHEYGVSEATISMIKTNKIWIH